MNLGQKKVMKKIISCMVICSLLSFFSCSTEEPAVKTLSVTTDSPTNVTATNVTLGGNVTDDGGNAVTSKGVCVSLTANPTIDDPNNDVKLEIGTGVGAFTDSYTGFEPSTTYHVRAYATNGTGTVYGEDKMFTTLASTGFSVTTDIPANITSTEVTLGGNATNDGGSSITSKGICISLTINPSIDDADDITFEMGTGLGAFTELYTGFDPGTTYHVRAYATNSTGTVYGEDEAFTTLTGCPVVNVNTSNAALSISTPTTWLSGKVYVVTGNVTVTSTLTIEAGAIIKINGARISVNSAGKILANGTAENRIVFTSIFDDSYCGDTNGDGAATTPNKGDWTSIYLNGGTGNTFKYCDFLYAGKNDGGYNNCVYISVAGTSFEFDNCTFAHTLSSGNSTAFVFHGGSYMEDNTVSKFTNNAFYDNDRPLFINTYYNLSTTNIFHNPSNASQKNTRNSIWLYNTTNQGATITFGVSEVPYVFTAFFNGGGSGATDIVNINANVILKFENTSAGISKSASRQVNLNASAVLTSIKDDTHGGDTNGDGAASSPANSDWDGYYNYATTTYLSGANIFYDAH
jgi:phage baseplate assembly protein gpV